MDKNTAKAINEVSKKVNDIQRRLDAFFNDRCDENKESVNITDGGVIDIAELLSLHNDAIIELADIVSELAEERGK